MKMFYLESNKEYYKKNNENLTKSNRDHEEFKVELWIEKDGKKIIERSLRTASLKEAHHWGEAHRKMEKYNRECDCWIRIYKLV